VEGQATSPVAKSQTEPEDTVTKPVCVCCSSVRYRPDFVMLDTGLRNMAEFEVSATIADPSAPTEPTIAEPDRYAYFSQYRLLLLLLLLSCRFLHFDPN
jgi:hypothetical protein